MATRARAAVLDRPNGRFQVEEYPVPELAAGQMLLRTELNGICATDTHIYKGEIPWVPYPVVMGHEFVGRIEALNGVAEDSLGKPVRVGDRVVPMAATPCGRCYGCTMKPNPDFLCESYDLVGFSSNDERKLYGGLAEVVHLANPALRFFRTGLPPELAVLTEPFATPVHGVERVGVRPGDQVLVQGPGTVGILAIAAARAAGAGRVIVIGGPSRRLEIARAFGADVTVDLFDVTDRDERIRLVRDATLGRRGVDVAIECAGVPSAVTEGIECLRNGGRYAELGHFSDVGAVPVNPWKHLLANNITLIGSSGYMAKHFRRALDIIERRAFPFELLVTHKLPLARAADGMLALTPEGGWQVDGMPAAKITVAPQA